MTSFYDLSFGEVQEFLRLLTQEGFTQEDVRKLEQNPFLLQEVMGLLRNDRTPIWYVSPKRQLERMKQLNKNRKWGFRSSDFPLEIPTFQMETPTEVLLLAVYLPAQGSVGGVQRTFNEHIAVIKNQLQSKGQSFQWQSHDPEASLNRLSLLPGRMHYAGVRWVVFDPQAHCDAGDVSISPARLQEQVMEEYPAFGSNAHLASSEVLSAFMLFPGLAEGMGRFGGHHPWLSLSGYRTEARLGRTLVAEWRHTGNEGLRLAACVDRYLPNTAAPTVRSVE